MRAAALLVVLGGCLSMRAPQAPAVYLTGTCHSPQAVFAGYPVITTIRSRPGVVADVRASCGGMACRTSIVPIDGETREVVVMPEEPGVLAMHYALARGDGTQQLEHATCRVAPRPAAGVACAVRDRATGGYVPCPAHLAPDIDVFLSATVTTARDGTHDSKLDLLAGGRDVFMRCDSEHAGGQLERHCSWHTQPGSYELRLTWGNLIEQLAFDVGE